MADIIKLVRGDNRPFVRLTLTDTDTEDPINLTGATIVVYFRKAGTTTVLETLTCTGENGGALTTDGVIEFSFPGTALDVAAGSYEGEVEITYSGGDIQTLYDILKFKVREQFA